MTAPHFTEEWFSPQNQGVLSDLVKLVAKVPGEIVEIGAWEGRSTVVMANTAYPRFVTSCDTWAGSPHEVSFGLAAQRDVHAQWVANIAALTHGNVIEFRGDWRDLVPTLGTVALAFIDAEHSRKEVRDNIAALLPKMAVGGILCGDDAHHPPVMEGVADVLPIHDVTVLSNVWFYVVPPGVSSPVEVEPKREVSGLEARYRELCEMPSDVYLYLPLFVELVGALKAQHVIELGTRTGVSTVAFLYGLEGTGGRLTSVDIDPAPEIGEHDHWTFVQGDDCDPEVFSALEPADIVFIDTSHTYEHTLRELGLYRWLVKPGGVMLLHDTEVEWPEGAGLGEPFPVMRAVSEFCERERLQWANRKECWGLAIVKVD